jgi:hypothetical protein
MCSCRRCRSVVVEVAERDIAVVEVVMVNDVVVVRGVAAFARGAKNSAGFLSSFFFGQSCSQGRRFVP